METLHCAKEGKLILKECINPKLKNEGFRKKGNTFYRSRGEFIDVVNVQFGSSNSKDYSYFTYNITISMPSLYEKLNLHYEKELDCEVVYFRLGSVICRMKNLFPTDYWYKIGHRGPDMEIISELIRNGCNTPGITAKRIEELKEELKTLNLLENRYDFKNIEQIRETVMSDIDTVVIPFFNKINNYDALAELIESKSFFQTIEKLFLFMHYIDKSETTKAIEIAKSLSSNKFYKDWANKYLYDKGINSYID